MTFEFEKIFDHLAGGLIGLFTGDALGMPVEGWSARQIRWKHGFLSSLLPGRFPRGWYTDDTQMAIGILEVLAAEGRPDPAAIARRFLANFDPARGYGSRISGIMDRLRAGDPWDRVGADSFGNGAAMRVAPIGLFYFQDLDSVARCAAEQARITHTHPEAIAGAVVQAGASALAMWAGLSGIPVDVAAFNKILMSLARPIDARFNERLRPIFDITPGPLSRISGQIRRIWQCDVTAIEAVPPAVAAFLLTGNFRDAVTLAVNLGGDTDTIGAMAGALAGAYAGLSRLPVDWVDDLENENKGRDYILDLCRQTVVNMNAS